MLYENIKKLVQYGVETGLTPACEKNYTINLLLDVFKEDEYVEPEEEYRDIDLEEVLNALLDEAVKRNLIEDSVVYRDLFDTRLMNCLMPRPAQVQNEFWSRYEKDPQEATDYFYKLSQDSDYIRRYRVKKDQKWTVDSEYGKNRYHHQSFQTGKRSEGNRCCQACKIQQLSEMSSLPGERRICRKS